MKISTKWFVSILSLVVLLSGCPKRSAVQKAARPKPVAPQKSAAAKQPQQPGQLVAGTRAKTEASVAPPVERYDQPDEAAAHYRQKRIPAGSSEIPVERYLNAQEQMNRMPQFSTATDRSLPSREELRQQAVPEAVLPAWTPLGPGNIGGRTRALLIHPTNPNVMYAAGVAGGVWKSTNAGGTWTPISDLIANLAVCALALDTKNPETIYAATGEGFFNGDGLRGAGIFKTTDGGANWAALASTNNENFHYVNDLVISPNNSQRLYAATRTGVWRSTDAGLTWTRVLETAVMGGCTDLMIRTDQTSDYLFTACGNLAQATIYRNADAAGTTTWSAVQTESGMGRTSLALAPSNQSIIYAVSASITPGFYDGGLHAVFRSTSNGDSGSWVSRVRGGNNNSLNSALLTNAHGFCILRIFGRILFSNQGWYDNVVAVDPLDANRVWVGGVDIFRSDDGGANFGLASTGSANRLGVNYSHVDNHALVFHPNYDGVGNKTLYLTSDGGIYRTDDARANVTTGVNAACETPVSGAVTWTSLNNSYGVTQFYHGLPYPNGTTYFGGTQDNGTLRGTDADGINGWREIHGGDGGYVAVDPTNTNVLYTENTGLSLQKSTDGGATFNPATTGITESRSNFLFITPYLMDPSDPQRLWIGGRSLWRTINGAANWTQASAPLAGTSSSLTSALAVAPTDANYVLAGTSEGFIHRTDTALTTTATTTWLNAQPRTGYVSWLAFDPTNKNIAYATYSTFGGTHVWKSSNGGASWTGIDGSGATGIPDIPVHCIVVDPANPARLYVGTDLGVFISTDGGASWGIENTGFANVVTESLSLNVLNGTTTLFAFTHGRGVWRVQAGTSDCPTLTFMPASLPAGTVGAAYNQTISVSPSGSYTFAVTAGALPAGLSLNSATGALTGTPTMAGTASFTITASTTTSSGTCTGSQAYTLTIQAQACQPVTVTALNPTSGEVGSAVTITGANFTSVSAVRFANNVSASFTVNSESSISATVSSGAVTGTITISKTGCPDVQTPVFTVTSPPLPCQMVSGLSPTSGIVGSAVTITGENFAGVTAVRFSNNVAATFTVNSSGAQISTTVPNGAVTGPLTISKPGCPDVQTGAFTVVVPPNPVPVLTSLNPSSAAAGGAAFTLTVAGTNFVTSSVVRWNGSDRPTSFVSATQLTAAIAASDIASAGNASVTVFTPTPGGGVSGALTFAILPSSLQCNTVVCFADAGTWCNRLTFVDRYLNHRVVVPGVGFNQPLAVITGGRVNPLVRQYLGCGGFHRTDLRSNLIAAYLTAQLDIQTQLPFWWIKLSQERLGCHVITPMSMPGMPGAPRALPVTLSGGPIPALTDASSLQDLYDATDWVVTKGSMEDLQKLLAIYGQLNTCRRD